ncbi:hypothetical protein GYA27_02555 [candidate division WWE3 bacterium]|uniref:Uncharacterized protein n=1 Tax=candidate division WWE3 bacterium TaxID=2053526 RepID=A0A7X9HHY4_UNCKA|nr:hypothetical protein [candidate division WWE3 bacterium]
MLVPVLRRVTEKYDVFIERAMPVQGSLYVKQGDTVEPFDHIGDCIYAQRSTYLPQKFSPKGFKKNGQFYYANMELGSHGKEKIMSQYDGYLFKNTQDRFEFGEAERKYPLLSGVWGVVDKVIEKSSVLIKAPVKDICLPVCSSKFFAGELIVFPNPSSILEKFYLDQFSAQSADGKIVYVGNHVNMVLLQQAVKSGWGGVLAGSTDRETYAYAKANNITLGVFTGFGEVATPEDIYQLLNLISNRYVFFYGEKNLLRIPTPPTQESDEVEKAKKYVPLKPMKKGANVIVLDRQFFGEVGVVDRVLEFSIFVKFPDSQKTVEVKIPNLLTLE